MDIKKTRSECLPDVTYLLGILIQQKFRPASNQVQVFKRAFWKFESTFSQAERSQSTINLVAILLVTCSPESIAIQIQLLS